MSEYEKSKKVRRITAVVYLLIMSFVVGGTYLSQQQKPTMITADPTPQQSDVPSADKPL